MHTYTLYDHYLDKMGDDLFGIFMNGALQIFSIFEPVKGAKRHRPPQKTVQIRLAWVEPSLSYSSRPALRGISHLSLAFAESWPLAR